MQSKAHFAVLAGSNQQAPAVLGRVLLVLLLLQLWRRAGPTPLLASSYLALDDFNVIHNQISSDGALQVLSLCAIVQVRQNSKRRR